MTKALANNPPVTVMVPPPVAVTPVICNCPAPGWNSAVGGSGSLTVTS